MRSWAWNTSGKRSTSPAARTCRPEFLALNDRGKVPVLRLDDGRTLSESNAILDYLAQGTHLLPDDPGAARRRCSGCSSSNTATSPTSRCRASSAVPAARASAPRVTQCAAGQRGQRRWRRWSGTCIALPWFGGEQYTIADIALFAYTHVADEAGFDLAAYPQVERWLEARDAAARLRADAQRLIIPLFPKTDPTHVRHHPDPDPRARMKGVNRAEVCDVNFSEFVKGMGRHAGRRSLRHTSRSSTAARWMRRGFRDLFESQLISRHLDLMARVLRVQNKVFYTIGSSGHEGNAMVARADAAYRSQPSCITAAAGLHGRALPQAARHGSDHGFGAELRRQRRTIPASGGRHKVWGSKPLWVLPQTSTIASHLPKALGTAVAIESRAPHRPPAADSRTTPSRSARSAMPRPTMRPRRPHSTRRQWTAYQKLPAPVLYVCEDNGIGISVKTPTGWIGGAVSATGRDLDYFFADGLDLASGYADVQRAVEHCRTHASPDLPAPAHYPDHGPRRHRLRDRVAQHRGTVRGRSRRSAVAFGADRAGIRPDVEGRDRSRCTKTRGASASPPPRMPTSARASDAGQQ